MWRLGPLKTNTKKDALAKNVQKEISVGSSEEFGRFTDLHIKAQRIRGVDGERERDPQAAVISPLAHVLPGRQVPGGNIIGAGIDRQKHQGQLIHLPHRRPL